MATRKVTAFLDPRNTVIKAFVDEFNDELNDAEKITRRILNGFLEDLRGKTATPSLSRYRVETTKTPQLIKIRGASFQFVFWKMRFLPPGGANNWNIINTLSTGRKGFPKRSEPYVMHNPGIVQGVIKNDDGGLWRQVQRLPTVTSPNSTSFVTAGETTPTLFTQGPIRPVPPRDFYPELLKECQDALKIKGIKHIELEIIQEG